MTSSSRALVPVTVRPPVRSGTEKPAAAAPAAATPAFDLVRKKTRLHTRAEVEAHLPDILGRALARIWIDPTFRDCFVADPKATLAVHDVFLPESILIHCVTEGQSRPLVIVYEQPPLPRPRRRLLYLQLVMMAGK